MVYKITFIKKLVLLSLLFFLPLFVAEEKAYAGAASVNTIPSSGSYRTNQSFQVDINVDGAGARFNAAKADVVVSPSLSVQSLRLGSCKFAYVKTPTQANPSFVGVILGNSSTSCTAYSLIIQAIGPNQGTITISNASVKEYKTAQEILGKTTSGTYVLPAGSGFSGNPITPTVAPVNSNGSNYYTVTYNPGTSNSQISLDPNTPHERTQTVSGDSSADVTFDNVPEGVHTIATIANGQQIASQIVNVAGNNKNLSFGITKNTSIPYLLALIALIAFAVIVIFALYLTYKTLRRRVIA